MKRGVMLAGFIAVSFAARTSAQQPFDSLRLITVSGSSCRTLPKPGAPIAERYHLGDVVGASKSTRDPAGRIWYFDSWRVKGTSPACWVSATVTAPFSREHPEPAFAAVAQGVLTLHESSAFEKLVEAENFLEEPNPYAGVGGSPLATSGLLQFRRLQIIENAAAFLDGHGIEGAPLKRAWTLAHRDLLSFYEPDAAWILSNDEYWKLYDANKSAPWTEELAWYAAQRLPPRDECGADCFLGMIEYGPQQYWARLPNGRSIDKVLALATEIASQAIGAIDEEAPTHTAIDGIRSSLGNVRSPAKQALLDRLARLDRAVKP